MRPISIFECPGQQISIFTRKKSEKYWVEGAYPYRPADDSNSFTTLRMSFMHTCPEESAVVIYAVRRELLVLPSLCERGFEFDSLSNLEFFVKITHPIQRPRRNV
jgi:hypothetical protein